jgi:integrase/recombinase XerD
MNSAPGCALTAASPTLRSIPTTRLWAIFLMRSATMRRPTRLTPYGRSSSNAPDRMAWHVQDRSPLRRARFCASSLETGRCPPGLEYAVPGFAGWWLASVPGFLAPAEIERILAACAGESRLRDKAVVLFLAGLGLRASEVANLDLHQIDWRNGRLAVAGKSRRAEWLPLTQEVGDAILALPTSSASRQCECSLRPAHRSGLSLAARHARSVLVSREPVRALIFCATPRRHRCSATASALPVSALLRHCDPTMTMHYAKIDFALLSEIAQLWAGSPAC